MRKESRIWDGISYLEFVPPIMKGDFFMSKVTSRNVSSQKLKKLVVAAVFCALAFASMFIVRINVMFLTFDSKDAVVTIAGLLLGPVYSLAISVTVAVLESITVGDTGIWGFLMDLLSTTVFSCTCALIYKHKKNIKGAVVGLLSSVFAMTAFMILFNIFITPIYMGVTTSEVVALIPSLFLPFNLTKAILNAALVLILYKPASVALKATKVLPQRSVDVADETAVKKKNIKFSLTVTAIGVVILAVCLVVFFVLLGGKITFG